MAEPKRNTFQRLKKGQLNRKERRDLEKRLNTEDPGLEIVNRNVAGIDVGNETHYVAVPPGRDPQPVQEFGSWTADLERMADWLKTCGIETVVMQSTGVYWIALYDVLEKRGFNMCLANARHTKNLPGRKSDVQESQWLLKLHTYGLLRNSFRPPDEIRALRSLWRLRDRHVKEAARTVQHMQKSMITMNVQLSNTINDLRGTTGLAIIRAILNGEKNPEKLAKLRDWRIKASEEEVARSIEGNWREDMLFELRQSLDAYDFIQKQVAGCDRRLQTLMAELPMREAPAAMPAVGGVQPPKTGARNANSPPYSSKPRLTDSGLSTFRTLPDAFMSRNFQRTQSSSWRDLPFQTTRVLAAGARDPMIRWRGRPQFHAGFSRIALVLERERTGTPRRMVLRKTSGWHPGWRRKGTPG